MTNEQSDKMIQGMFAYLKNNYKLKSKQARECERSMMIGAYAALIAVEGEASNPWLMFCLLGHRYLTDEYMTKEMQDHETVNP